MDTGSPKLTSFLGSNNVQFVIPVYQRNYDWKEDNCRQLLDDIIEVGKTPKEANKVHFIGSIVYVCNSVYTTEDIKKFVIIDGQQRITTITLLLIALYHHALQVQDFKLADMIRETYLINKYAEEDEYKVKLKATDNNEKDLQALLDGQPIPDNKYSNIKNNYNFFKKQITDENRSIIYEGIKRLLIVEVILERGKDNAQKIFESLNSTGLDLSQADLIRNYILMGLEPQEQNRLYKNYWAKIEGYTKRGGESLVSNFVRDFLTMKMGEIPNEKKVYVTFKKQYPIENGTVIETVLEDLLKYSEIYSSFIKPESIGDKDIRREIEYIDYIKMNVCYPFLMQVANDYKQGVITKDIYINVLKFVQAYACRRFILELPTNSLNKIFMTLYRQIDIANYEDSLYRYILTRSGKVRMPSDTEIRDNFGIKNLYEAKSKLRDYILEKLENYNNHEFVPIIDNSEITIEHIFPQRPEAGWKQDLPEKTYTDFMEKYLHTIGNLTLSGNNGALGNKSFPEKKNMNKDGKEQGYVYSRLWSNRFLSEIDSWTIENYQKRTDIMIKRFINVWPLPQVEGIKETPEQNIFDIDNPTDKQLEYALFFGTRLNGDKYKYWTTFYKHIIVELYKLLPDGFVENFGEILRLRETSKDFHRYGQLNSTYYFDVNLSALDMFSNLKKILSKLDLTDELYIKFRGATVL